MPPVTYERVPKDFTITDFEEQDWSMGRLTLWGKFPTDKKPIRIRVFTHPMDYEWPK